MKPPSSSPTSAFVHSEVTPASPPSTNLGNSAPTSLGLKERCVAVDTISLVARILNKSKAPLQSMLLQSNVTVLEDLKKNFSIAHYHMVLPEILVRCMFCRSYKCGMEVSKIMMDTPYLITQLKNCMKSRLGSCGG